LQQPQCLAFDSNGTLYESDLHTIYKFTPDGIRHDFTSQIGLTPEGLAFNGFLFESDPGSNSILKFDFLGNATTFATGLGLPWGLAFDSSGNLYEGSDSSIFKFTPSGFKTLIADGLGLPTALAFDSDGDLFVADHFVKKILEINPDGTQSTFVGGLNSLYGIAFSSVPEPSTFVLSVIGTISLLVYAVRWRQVGKKGDKSNY
jgi:hypothetical protein